jgi:hypothetical protein
MPALSSAERSPQLHLPVGCADTSFKMRRAPRQASPPIRHGKEHGAIASVCLAGEPQRLDGMTCVSLPPFH